MYHADFRSAGPGSRLNFFPTPLARPMLSLDQLRIGQRACIAGVEGDDSVVQRLMEMGLLEGEYVEVIGVAPLGDPLEIQLRDYRLCLRRSEAARIVVHEVGRFA
jgi:ferrous iron transport protein A